jgi:uncharacterized damage-inducible protein DinB
VIQRLILAGALAHLVLSAQQNGLSLQVHGEANQREGEENFMVAITAEELQEWVENMSSRWRKLLSTHPEILSFPCDIRETSTVAQLLQHIVAVELRYAERLNELPQTEYGGIPYNSVDALYATHDRAMEMLRPLLNRDEAFWETVLEMKTRSAGILRASRRTVLVHLLTHSVRHYAQLATLVRNHGIPSGIDMDYILMRLVPSV